MGEGPKPHLALGSGAIGISLKGRLPCVLTSWAFPSPKGIHLI